MVWNNAPAKVYHGTIESDANTIVSTGVNPRLGKAAADFGKGFYLTSVLVQAQQWANQKARRNPRATKAAVISFELDRDLAALGQNLTFVIADQNFYDFVTYNRFGSATHARAGGKPYDVVFGPVAAYPQRLTYAACDQICFVAGGAALSALSTPRLSDVSLGSPYFP